MLFPYNNKILFQTQYSKIIRLLLLTKRNKHMLGWISYICLGYFVCVSVCVCVTIAERSGYSLCFSDQTDQGDKTEGLEREGLEMES